MNLQLNSKRVLITGSSKVIGFSIANHFLEEVAKQKRYTFISTGMSTEDDITRAVEIFRKHNSPLELMHCVSTYPMKTEDANLKTIIALKEKYKCSVGYSGHEPGVAISLAAISIGATSLERHITLDRSMYGSDQAASLEPRGLKELCNSIKKITIAMGNSKIGHVTKEENEIAKKLRAHLKKWVFLTSTIEMQVHVFLI